MSESLSADDSALPGSADAAAPAAPAGPENGKAPAAGDGSDRIAAIERIRDTDIGAYRRGRLDLELVDLTRKAAEGNTTADEDSDGQPDESVDGAADHDETGEVTEEPIVPAIGPPSDATGEEVAEWRDAHGVPDEAAGYVAPEIEGVQWSEEVLAPILEIIHKHNVPQDALAGALTAYGEQVTKAREKMREQDGRDRQAVSAALNAAEIAAVKSASRAMPSELRKMIREARLPTGRLLANQPDVLRMLAGLPRGAGGDTSSREQEIAKIRDNDIGRYRREQNGKGQTLAEEMLEIQRRKGAK